LASGSSDPTVALAGGLHASCMVYAAKHQQNRLVDDRPIAGVAG